MAGKQNYINHIVFVVDQSYSMAPRREAVVKVFDSLIGDLARMSKEMDQETRATVYTFSDYVQCIIYDKDVLRLPSLADMYTPNGNTALIEATLTSQEIVALTSQKYGDHAFLFYIITDGENNRGQHLAGQLTDVLKNLPENVTVGVLVPNQTGVFTAKRYGFLANNITVWDTASSTGVEDAGEVIQASAQAYMTSRVLGVRSTNSLFTMDPAVLNKNAVHSSGIVPFDKAKYVLVPVTADEPIASFVRNCGHTFRVGKSFYELSKTETIQGNKLIAVVEVATNKVFMGEEARRLVGLDDTTVRVKPGKNKDYKVFVQSASNNRKLKASTQLLILTDR